MSSQSYSTKFIVDGTSDQVFLAIKNVREWWPEIEGGAEKIGDTFRHRFGDMHRCELIVKEMIPQKRIAWTVVDNYFSFTKDQTEWKNTDIVFEIAPKGDGIEVKFTHVGLVPHYECYGVCSDAWGDLLDGALRALINGRTARIQR